MQGTPNTTSSIAPEVVAVLKDLGLATGKIADPTVTQVVEKVLEKVGDHGKVLSWFKKVNPMLGASPAEMIRLGRGPQLANYIANAI